MVQCTRSPAEDILINENLDPWDAMYILEARQCEPDFHERWRQFVRSVVPLLPGLPPEAAQWWDAADAYGTGQLDVRGLLTAQNNAWRYLSDLPDGTPDAAYCAVCAAMQPLWDHNTGGGWFDGAWCFLHDCGAAGVSESEWWPLFRAAYPEFGGGSNAD